MNMDLDTFRRSIPASKRHQSERMQISGFLSTYWDILHIADIQFVDNDPPDVIIKLQTGLRIGIELKRLEFSDPSDKHDIVKYKNACLKSSKPIQRFKWKPTTYATILNNYKRQLKATQERTIYERSKKNHDLEIVWLMFAVIVGNPAGMFVEYASAAHKTNETLPFPSYNRFAYEIINISEQVKEFDAILLCSGLHVLATKNTTSLTLPALNPAILESGKNDTKGLEDKWRIRSGVSHSGYLYWR